jgi:hypothetical protein
VAGPGAAQGRPPGEARRWFDQAAEKHKEVTARLGEEAAGLSLPEDWPEFEIGYREAALLGAGKP